MLSHGNSVALQHRLPAQRKREVTCSLDMWSHKMNANTDLLGPSMFPKASVLLCEHHKPATQKGAKCLV